MQTNTALRLCLQHKLFKARLGIASEVKRATGCQGVLHLSSDLAIYFPWGCKSPCEKRPVIWDTNVTHLISTFHSL